ncbi:MAG: hypothetical protein O2816_02180 [Planctomycetota bacterium]|nr:hypothetical protein [Planctomycetota bacterium]
MTVLIGIDGGASGVRLFVVDQLATGRLRLGARQVEHDWTRLSGFQPAPLDQQVAEQDDPQLERMEREEADAWIHTVANLVAEGVIGLRDADLRLGVCMPGVKTADGRGVAIFRRGPRLPHFVDDLNRQLRGRNLPLASPIERVSDDGDAAAWGEEWAAEGKLGGVPSGYLVNLGSGVAEGLKVEGGFVPIRSLRDVLPAPWLTGAEDRLGMVGLQRDLDSTRPIGALVRAGHPGAAERLTRWAEDLGAFLRVRLERLEQAGLACERVVVGARGGELLADLGLAEFTHSALENALASRRNRAMRSGFLVPSTLRAAPAIGVAADALELIER